MSKASEWAASVREAEEALQIARRRCPPTPTDEIYMPTGRQWLRFGISENGWPIVTMKETNGQAVGGEIRPEDLHHLLAACTWLLATFGDPTT
jgi:hypothetical protein